MNPDQGAAGDQRVRSGKRAVVFVVGCLLAVLVAGIAVGMGIRFPRRHIWALAAVVAVITLPLLLWAGRPSALAIALALTVALEMAIATLILRGRHDRLPALSAR